MNYMDFVKGGPVQVFVGERLKAGTTPKAPWGRRTLSGYSDLYLIEVILGATNVYWKRGNMGGASEGYIGILLVILLGIVVFFFYLFAREQQKDLREQQQRDNEKKQRYDTGKVPWGSRPESSCG
jgi:hypothetical protein